MLWTFIMAVYLFNIFTIPVYVTDLFGLRSFLELSPIRVDFLFYLLIILIVYIIVERREIPGAFYEGESQMFTRIVYIISTLMMLPFLADNHFIYYMRILPTDTFGEPFWFLFMNFPVWTYQMSTLLDFILGIAIWKLVDQWWKLPAALAFLAAVYLNLILFVLGLWSVHVYIQIIVYFFIMIGVIAAAIYATRDLRKRKYLLFKKEQIVERT